MNGNDQIPGPSRMCKSLTDANAMYNSLYLQGITQFCTCRQICAFMRHESEACDNGGDSGSGYCRFQNNIELSLS